MIVTIHILIFAVISVLFCLYLYNKYKKKITEIENEHVEIFSIINEELNNIHESIQEIYDDNDDKNEIISSILNNISAIIDDIINELPFDEDLSDEEKNKIRSSKLLSHDKLNDILDQIKEKGINSLTKEQRDFLQNYSKNK